jgi:hypothetical protein
MLDRLILHVKRIGLGAWKIRDVSEHLIEYSPNYAQEILLARIMEQAATEQPIRISSLKPRKIGISTATQVLFADLCGYHEHQTAKLIAHREENTREIFSVGRLATREHWTDSGQPMPNIDTFRIAWPKHGSSAVAETAGGDYVASGGSPNLLHLSEGPKWRMFNKRASFADVMNSLGRTPTSVCVIEFTAVGRDLFYNHWLASRAGKTGFKALFYPWFADRRNVA